MASTRTASATVSVAAVDTHTYVGTVVCRKKVDAEYLGAILIRGPDRYERRVNTSPSFAERLPNRFYGIEEVDSTSVSIANLDRKYSRILNEQALGRPVRARRYDQISGEIVDITHQVINNLTTGDDIVLSLVPRHLEVFQTALPKNFIGVTGEIDANGVVIPDPEATPDQLSTQFPNARDIGVPVNIVFGRTLVRCGYCNEDEGLQEFDYLVGEGTIEVFDVFKNSVKAFTAVRQISSVDPELLPNSDDNFDTRIVFADWLANPDDATDRTQPIIDKMYDGIWIKVLTGDAAGRYFRIARHTVKDSDDLRSTILIEGHVNVVAGDIIRVQEWMPLPNTVYKGRTAIRFGRIQKPDGSALALITADVARYRPVRKNFLFDTDGFDPREPTLDHPDVSSYWEPFGIDTLLDTTVMGPDDVTPSTKITGTDTTAALQQTIDHVLSASDVRTFSIWVRTGDAFFLEVFGNGSGGTSRKSAFGADGGQAETWRRMTVTKNGGWGTATDKVTIRVGLTNGTGDEAWVWGAQLEGGSSPTWYEAVAHGEPAGRHWSFPDAIAEIVSDGTFGLNQVLAMDTVEQANDDLFVGITDTDWLFLRCQGSLPDLSGTGGSAKDVLDELTQIRGLRLYEEGGTLKLAVDCPKDTIQQIFGTAETPYGNAFSSGNIGSATLSELVHTYKAAYAQDLAIFSTQDLRVYYPFLLSHETDEEGEGIKIYPFRFIRDHNTAARGLQYVAAATRLANKPVSVEVGDEGRNLRIGHLVTFIDPGTQPENRLKNSEDLTTASWIATNATVTAHEARDPDNLNWTGSRIVFSSAGSVVQTSTTTAIGKRAIGYVWVKGDAGEEITIAVSNGVEESTETIPIGIGYRKVRVEHYFSSTATGSIKLEIRGGGAFTCYVTQPQLVIDYDKEYVATDADAVLPTTTYRVHGHQRNDVDAANLDLTPYDATQLFTYVKPTFPSRFIVTIPPDPRLVPPDPPTGLSLPADVTSSAMGIDTRNGTSSAWAEISFVMPARNASGVIVQISVAGEERWIDVATLTVDEYGLATPVVVTARGLLSDTHYEVRLISFNQFGRYNGLDTSGEFVTP